MCGNEDSRKETAPEAPAVPKAPAEEAVSEEAAGEEAVAPEAVNEEAAGEEAITQEAVSEEAREGADAGEVEDIVSTPHEAAPRNDEGDEGGSDGDEPPDDLVGDTGENWGAGLPRERLLSRIESLIFTSPEPVSVRRMARILSLEGKDVRELADTLKAHYANRGIILEEISKGYQFRSHPDNAAMIRDVFKLKPVKMSRAALETLAIVAYRQPLTRAEAEQIRGVDSGGVLKYLFEKELVRVIGRKEEPGRPIIYGTSKSFLELFGLKSLSDLPALHEFSELWDEHQKLVDEEAPLSEDKRVRAPAPTGDDAENNEQTIGGLANVEEQADMNKKKEKETDTADPETEKDQSEVPTETLDQEELVALMRSVDNDRDLPSGKKEEDDAGLPDDADNPVSALDDEEEESDD